MLSSKPSQYSNCGHFFWKSFKINSIRFEKADKLNESLAYLNKALKIEPTNALIESKIKQINEKVFNLQLIDIV